MISFIFYFNSNRINNLHQTLRFLSKNENLKEHEVVLICNDSFAEDFDLPNYKIVNLNLDTYNKPKMCNLGVEISSNDIIALLDSDRILPCNYFEKTSKLLRPKQFISTRILHKLDKDYTDKNIEDKEYQYKLELKSKRCELYTKGMFSGNTLFFKRDFIEAGGMDESFDGHGFADNDMTINVFSKGYNFLWKNLIELHLNHEQNFLYKNKIIQEKNEFRAITIGNYFVFSNKWKDKRMKSFLKM